RPRLLFRLSEGAAEILLALAIVEVATRQLPRPLGDQTVNPVPHGECFSSPHMTTTTPPGSSHAGPFVPKDRAVRWYPVHLHSLQSGFEIVSIRAYRWWDPARSCGRRGKQWVDAG